MVKTLKTPEWVGSRGAARELLSSLPADLRDGQVHVGCADLIASSPSFVDELVREVLEQRNARKLKLHNVPPEVAHWANEAAERRGVGERIMVDVRPE